MAGRKVIYLRHKPTKQVVDLVSTNPDGSDPAITKETIFARFFRDYVVGHSLKVHLDDFEIGEREEQGE